jgi:putative methyltransferase (TIGR04325 family)
MNKYKTYIKALVPPIALTTLNKIRTQKYGFSGNYKTWEDALKNSTGYDSPDILERVKAAMLKVKSGEAVYERDSVLFDEKEYSWPLMAGILRTANSNDGCLGVLDFGGSLGSSYYQCKGFLSTLKKLRWCVVEQPSFVDVGVHTFKNNELDFYPNISLCKKHEEINIILMSGVLQYLENPHDVLQDILSLDVNSIIVDRTPFLEKAHDDLLTVQTVPPSIYTASYPHWFFEKSKFLKQFSNKGYQLVAEFEGYDAANIQNSKYCGFIFDKMDCIE